ncbi:hypothetical protein P4475_11745 [Halalkalibacterium halodurans]|nr:hypothetical protein [Halalkalibacterium halodurans]MED3647456.1 hypothetical protein [Halalkalibacterium halodurans]TES55687.1 hypothetical protein E2L07_07075 [Halalkalibacterium halodurans]TPE70085.1 hypothetical protein AMD02_005255 [Halalkalibacterium halodurans]
MAGWKFEYKIAIISSGGGLFDDYKVFNVATVAAATDQEVAIFLALKVGGAVTFLEFANDADVTHYCFN